MSSDNFDVIKPLLGGPPVHRDAPEDLSHHSHVTKPGVIVGEEYLPAPGFPKPPIGISACFERPHRGLCWRAQLFDERPISTQSSGLGSCSGDYSSPETSASVSPPRLQGGADDQPGPSKPKAGSSQKTPDSDGGRLKRSSPPAEDAEITSPRAPRLSEEPPDTRKIQENKKRGGARPQTAATDEAGPSTSRNVPDSRWNPNSGATGAISKTPATDEYAPDGRGRNHRKPPHPVEKSGVLTRAALGQHREVKPVHGREKEPQSTQAETIRRRLVAAQQRASEASTSERAPTNQTIRRVLVPAREPFQSIAIDDREPGPSGITWRARLEDVRPLSPIVYDEDRITSRDLWPPRSPDFVSPENYLHLQCELRRVMGGFLERWQKCMDNASFHNFAFIKPATRPIVPSEVQEHLRHSIYAENDTQEPFAVGPAPNLIFGGRRAHTRLFRRQPQGVGGDEVKIGAHILYAMLTYHNQHC